MRGAVGGKCDDGGASHAGITGRRWRQSRGHPRWDVVLVSLKKADLIPPPPPPLEALQVPHPLPSGFGTMFVQLPPCRLQASSSGQAQMWPTLSPLF